MKIFKLILLSTALAVSACNAETQSSAKTQSDIATLEYPTTIAPDLADRFSALALTCVHQEFPNKISRTTATAEEIGRPKKIFPAFYGCFDWHSSVHGHWLLVRLLRVGAQDAAWRDEAIAKLSQSFTAENIAGEVTNYNRPEGGSWERPYGLAWYLQLTAELREWAKENNDPQAKEWLEILEPLEADIANGLKGWLPRLAYPIRLGTHNQSAFAFGLMLDWARVAGDTEMERLIIERSKACLLYTSPSPRDRG